MVTRATITVARMGNLIGIIQDAITQATTLDIFHDLIKLMVNQFLLHQNHIAKMQL